MGGKSCVFKISFDNFDLKKKEITHSMKLKIVLKGYITNNENNRYNVAEHTQIHKLYRYDKRIEFNNIGEVLFGTLLFYYLDTQ